MRRLIAVGLALTALSFVTPARAQVREDVQIIAMSTFVENHCVGMTVNRRLVRDTFERTGGYPGWHDNPFHRTLVTYEVNSLTGDVPRSCGKLWNLYGEQGVIRPGLIEEDATTRRPIIRPEVVK